MFSRSLRGWILPGFILLALGAIVVWAVIPDSQDSSLTSARAADPVGTSVVAANPATATMPSATGKPSATATATAKKSARTVKPSATAATARGTTATSAAAVPTAGSGAAVSGSTVYGVSDPTLTNQSAAVQVQQLEAMKAMGFTSVRLDASWYWGQPNGPGSFSWGVMDQVISSIEQVGLSADLIIDGCPAWAAVSGTAGSQWAQPASAADFATWAAAVAARYGPKGVKYFEIWNEPNLAAFWDPKPDPSAYTADLKAAYAAIKQADPSAVVLSGGLAPAEDDGTNYDPRTFLQDMYADGAGGSFDELGYHPYSYPVSPDTNASWSGWSMMSQTSPSIRSIMDANGDSGKQIWITEYGAPTSGPNSVGEGGQGTDLVQAITQVKQLSWVGSLYIYTWSDISTLPADQDGFGLLNDDGTQKPSYSGVAAALGG